MTYNVRSSASILAIVSDCPAPTTVVGRGCAPEARDQAPLLNTRSLSENPPAARDALSSSSSTEVSRFPGMAPASECAAAARSPRRNNSERPRLTRPRLRLGSTAQEQSRQACSRVTSACCLASLFHAAGTAKALSMRSRSPSSSIRTSVIDRSFSAAQAAAAHLMRRSVSIVAGV